jgi:hypothetical protein
MLSIFLPASIIFYELQQDILILILNKKFWEELIAYFTWYDTERIENDASNNYSIVACVFVAAVTFFFTEPLPSNGSE